MNTLIILAAAFNMCSLDHYVAFNNQNTSVVQEISTKPGIVGFSKTFYWKDLEPVDNEFNWNVADSYMQAAESNNLKFFMFPHWRGFNGSDPVPDFVYKELQKDGESTIALLWQPEAASQLKNLYAAIAARYKDHPNFGGILMQETALGLGTWDRYVVDNKLDSLGYTVEGFKNSYVDIGKYATSILYPKKVFMFPTWFATDYPGAGRDDTYTSESNLYYVRQVNIDMQNIYNVYLGGPDILPNNPDLKRMVYPAASEGYNVKHSFMAQFDSFRHLKNETEYYTVEEIAEYTSTELDSRVIFWTYNKLPQNNIDDVFTSLSNNQCIATGCH